MHIMRSILLVVLVCNTVQTRAQDLVPLVSSPRPTVEAYRLLFESVPTSEGLRVISIQPSSPTLNMTSAEAENLRGIMEIGDIVAAVNGQPVRTIPEYQVQLQLAAATNPRVQITLLDGMSREPHRWLVQARKVRVPAQSLPDSGRRKAHFLLIGLTDDPIIGTAMKDTLRLWQQPIEALAEDRRGNIRMIYGHECRATKIQMAVRDLEVAARDTVFCVYCGHGAFDPAAATGDDPSRGHHFQIRPSGDLLRKTLFDALLAKGARLTVFITDTCNVQDQAFPAVPMVEEQRTVSVLGFSPFEQLLFDYRGIVDISGTDFGQYGFCQPGYGAWFSASAIPVLQTHNDWRSAFEQIHRVVDNDFQLRRLEHNIAQLHMTPRAFRLDTYRDEARKLVATYIPPQQREMTLRVRREVPR